MPAGSKGYARVSFDRTISALGDSRSVQQLFYDFRLEDHIPEEHMLRKLDKVLRFDGIRASLATYYSHTGRPSIDPELMLRMMLIG
jgi:transposase